METRVHPTLGAGVGTLRAIPITRKRQYQSAPLPRLLGVVLGVGTVLSHHIQGPHRRPGPATASMSNQVAWTLREQDLHVAARSDLLFRRSETSSSHQIAKPLNTSASAACA
jgi:hypothetical protein